MMNDSIITLTELVGELQTKIENLKRWEIHRGIPNGPIGFCRREIVILVGPINKFMAQCSKSENHVGACEGKAKYL